MSDHTQPPPNRFNAGGTNYRPNSDAAHDIAVSLALEVLSSYLRQHEEVSLLVGKDRTLALTKRKW